MNVNVKICGITRLQDAQAAYSLKAWALGFIFYPKSSRYIAPNDAKNIIQALPKNILKIGVFVNAGAAHINETQADLGLDFVQLHGDETPAQAAEITGPTIQAFRPRLAADLQNIAQYTNAKMILMDAASTQAYGGTGEKADWVLARQAKKMGKPLILSGGLNAGNIQEALRVVQPRFIDLSSGVEDAPGIKNAAKMQFFFESLY